MNKIYGYDNNIYETSISDLSNSGLRIYEGNVSTSTDKVVVNGVEVTDIESWNKALDTFTNLEQKIEEKDKEIERLNNIIEEIQHKAYLGMKENENKTNEFQQAFTVAYRYIYNEINKLKELKGR